MAESDESLQFGRSIDIGSDQVPEVYCEPCFEIDSQIKPIAGYCKDCSENLCVDCFTSHRGPKLFRRHQLVDNSTRPKIKPTPQVKPHNSVECLLHHGESIQAFCQQHSQLCCKVCVKLNHQACNTEKVSKLARNIQDSQELTNLNKKLIKLKQGFDDNLTKTGANELVIQRNHKDANDEINKLQEKFEMLMNETRKQADEVKENDLEKIENVSDTCTIVMEQIDKTVSNIDTLREKGENDSLFISMKRAENQIQSLEQSLKQLDKDGTVREYKFEAEEKVKTILTDLKVLLNLSFNNPSTDNIYSSVGTLGNINISDQKAKKPVHIKDIKVKSSSEHNFDMGGSVVLPNDQVLITDWYNHKVKLIDTSQNKILSEIHLPGRQPYGITKVSDTQYAVAQTGSQNIQFLSLTQESLSLGRTIPVNGQSGIGLAYNSRDQTFIVTYTYSGKVDIINMSGAVIKSIKKDKTGGVMFTCPCYVALSPSMGEMYVSDKDTNTVTCMTMNGDVIAVYKDSKLQGPQGICVHKSGVVYVVGYDSNTVHQLDPDSGEFKTILEEKDGITSPKSVSYCEVEDKMYIGMFHSDIMSFKFSK